MESISTSEPITDNFLGDMNDLSNILSSYLEDRGYDYCSDEHMWIAKAYDILIRSSAHEADKKEIVKYLSFFIRCLPKPKTD